MHMTANSKGRADAPSTTSLLPRADQPESWVAHERPVAFDEAAKAVLDAHRLDGERDDIVVHQLRTWAFGSSDGQTMQLTRVPFEGRAEGDPLALRELGFTQLCAKIGARKRIKGTVVARSGRECGVERLPGGFPTRC